MMYRLVQHRLRLAAGVFVLIVLGIPQLVSASGNTDLRIRILPKDCVFDVVNAGTQELIFYTPAACGVPVDNTTPITTDQSAVPTPPISNTTQLPRPVPRPDLLGPPVVDPSSGGIEVSGNQIVLDGTTAPNAQVNIYVGGVLAGSTFADSTGNWTFTYIANSSPVIFRLEACNNNNCSILGDSIVVEVDLGDCSTSFELAQYRFTGAASLAVQLDVAQTSGDGVIFVDWGDGAQEERFDHTAARPTPYTKTYDKKGSYNGVIKFQQGVCEKIRYFSVQVTEQKNSYWQLYVILVIFILTSAWYLRRRYKNKKSKANF